MLAQMDYIFFVNGFAFILLAAVCFVLHQPNSQLSWRLLAFFGLFHGLDEWTEMLAFSLGGGTLLTIFILLLMTLSFFFLLEFARHSWIALHGKGPGWWIYIPLICVMGLGTFWGISGYSATTRYALAFPGGLWSAYILFLAARQEKVSGRGLLVASSAMALYAVAVGAIVPAAGNFPVNLINHPEFLALTSISIHLTRTILALLIVIGIGASYRRSVHEAAWMNDGVSLPPSLTGWPLVAGLLVLVFGWGATAYIGHLETHENRKRIFEQAHMGTAAIELVRLQHLMETSDVLAHPDYKWLQEHLQMMRVHDPNIFRTYVLLLRGNTIVTVADSPEDSEPDRQLSSVSPALAELFIHNQSLFVGPFNDKRGAVISVFISIHDQDTGVVSGVFGMDVTAHDWQMSVAQTRLIPILATLLVAILLIVFLVIRQRAWQVTELINVKEHRLAEAQRIAHLGGWDWDPSTRRFLWSDEMFRIMGISDPAFTPSPESFLQLVHPFDRVTVIKAMRQLMRGKDLPGLEFRILHPDGDVRVVLAQGKTWCDANGIPVRAAGNILDITERKETEAELRRYQDFLEQEVKARTAELTEANDALRLSQFAVDNSVDAVFWVRADATVFYVNDAACRMLGYTREELLQMSTYDLNLDLPRDAWAAHWQELIARKMLQFEAPMRAKDGHVVFVEFSVNYIEDGERSFNCAFVRDITERKHAFETAQYLAAIVEYSEDAIYTKDNAFILTSWNESAERLYQYSRAEAIGQHISIIVPEDRIEELHRITTMCKQGDRVAHFRTVRRRKDGELIDVSLSVSLLRDERGHIIGFSAIARDITVRIRMEEALQIKTEELDRFFNVVLDLLCIADTDGHFRRINYAWEKTLGYTNEELMAIKFPDLVHPEDRIYMLNAISQLGVQQNVLNFTNRCRCKDGSYRWIEWHSTLAGNLIFAAARDITERRQAEIELQKLALVVKNANELINMSDLDGRMIFINDAGGRMVGIDPSLIDQHLIFDVVSDAYQEIAQKIVFPSLLEQGHWEGNLQYRNLQTGQLTDVYAITFLIRDPTTDEPIFLANVSLDVTEHKRAEAEREDLIRGLQEALTEVKVLSGLLPICANCKKIRDDTGYWTQIEQYLHEHSGTRFSHGICPDCLRTFYPEFAEEILQESNESNTIPDDPTIR